MSQSFEDLAPELRRFARRLTGNEDLADEIAQESLTRALQRDQGAADIANPRAWLFQIAANVFKQWWRTRQRESRAETNLRQRAVDRSESQPPDTLAQREHLQQVWNFLQSLPDRQRDVLLLSIRESLSPAEIAQRLGLQVGNVRSHLYEARGKLRARFLE